MPELPEVELVRRTLEPQVQHQTIQRVTISDTVQGSKDAGKEAIIKQQSIPYFVRHMTGKEILSIRRRGKYLIFSLRDEEAPDECSYLINHLGMTGAWFVVRSLDDIAEAKYTRNIHATFHLEDGRLLVYSDQRRFGELRFLTEEEFGQFEPIQQMGPEPLEPGSFPVFLANIQVITSATRTIKEALLDQRVLAGIGNIYVCEALFRSRLHPKTPVVSVAPPVWKEIFQHLQDLLEFSISVGGASLSDYVDATGAKGSFQTTMHVYAQTTCSDCDSPIDNIQIKSRSSFFCPTCQTFPEPHIKNYKS